MKPIKSEHLSGCYLSGVLRCVFPKDTSYVCREAVGAPHLSGKDYKRFSVSLIDKDYLHVIFPGVPESSKPMFRPSKEKPQEPQDWKALTEGVKC